jgi:starch phosphorylase
VLAGLRPDEVLVQAVLGRVDSTDILQQPEYIDMTYTGPGEGGTECFSATTPLPLAGSMGYTARVLPRHPLLAGTAELGLVKLAADAEKGDSEPAVYTHL